MDAFRQIFAQDGAELFRGAGAGAGVLRAMAGTVALSLFVQLRILPLSNAYSDVSGEVLVSDSEDQLKVFELQHFRRFWSNVVTSGFCP